MSNRVRRTVLIVEDSPEDREMYRRYLMRDRDYDYTIIEASLGKEGLNLWHQHQPDTVLLDYRLPDLDGLEFLAALQTQGQQLPLPIVMVTGSGNEAIAVQAVKAGAQDYLVKTQITPEGLKLALDTTIKTVQLQTQLQQRVDRERVISQISQKVFRSLDLNEILHTTVTEVRQFLQTDHVVVFQVEPDGNGRVVAESVGADWRSILAERIHDPCFVESYVDLQRQGRVTVKADIYDGSIDPCHVQLLAGCQVKANLVVPILHDDQFWGVLIAHHCAAPRQWQSLEIDLLQQLSTQVSIAIRQAELYQQAQDELADRKQNEASLHDNEQLLRLAMSGAYAGSWDWEILTGRVVWSAENYVLYGLDPANGLPSYAAWEHALHPDDRDRANAEVQRVLEQHLPEYQSEFRIIHPQLGVRWLLGLGRITFNQQGEPVRLSGINLDITDRKRSAEALQESEARFRQLAENIDAVFWLKEEPEGRVSYASSAFERLWAWQPQELYESASFWVDHIHPDDREWTHQAFQSKAAAGQFDEEYRIVLDDGRIRWVHDRCFPLYDQSGGLYRFAGIAEDVTDRIRSKEALQQSEEFKDRVLESSSDCIKVVDLNAQLLYVNAGGVCLLEIDDVTSYLNSDWLCFWQGDHRQAAEAAFTAAKSGKVGKFQGFCPTVKGNPKWWDVVVTPMRNGAGRVVQILSISRDVSDRKLAELERERILQLKQAALEESERVNRIKDEFLAVLSHELRSPLNPILGWTKLLQTRKLDETKTIAALETIERNAKTQCQLIDDLLDMARVLRGKLSLNTAPVDLLKVIESAIDTVQTAAIAKSIQIHAMLSDIGQVAGDAVRLQQIIWNLLTNAVKFTPSGGRIDIRLEQSDYQAQLTITDTGKGISPDFLPYIFESFRQEDASVTRKHGGLGLGMAIVYQLVEAHGGTVTADSPGAGKGTTFTVRLPLLNVNSEENQSSPLREQNLDLTSIRVLVIDDELDSRELLAVMLAQAGAEAMSVTSAAEFLTALESFQPDVMVSDIGMPEVDGYTLLRQVRSLPPEQGGQVPAIALTAYAGESDRQQAIAAGFQKHIAKPIEPDQLVVAIVSLLSRRSLS